MANDNALLLVAEVLHLHKRHPEYEAVQVLDQAVNRNAGGIMDFRVHRFAANSLCHPSSPFAEVLRQAFARDLAQQAAASPDDAKGRSAEADAAQWQARVIEPFLRRYALDAIF